jgi:type III pantothenate kinase
MPRDVNHHDDIATVDSSDWLGLVIGNSRLHWAWFDDSHLRHTWDTPHLTAIPALPTVLDVLLAIAPDTLPTELVDLATQDASVHLPLWVVSVVADQLAHWQHYPSVRCITAAQIPIAGLYPTLGIDRAVALLGAICRWGAPVLVIDGGTALTFTGADITGRLVGGAILPGLDLQGRSLHQFTATLPQITFRTSSEHLPPRWALATDTAIRSGILYTTVAGVMNFIEAWQQTFPQSPVILTGGDGALLAKTLGAIAPQQTEGIKVDPNLVFHGMAALRQEILA